MNQSNIYYNKKAQWGAYIVLFVLLLTVPLFSDDPFSLNQMMRYCVYALAAVSVSLVWGYGGILSLGQGIAFGMGAYGMGATMQMQFQDPVGNPVPSFMMTHGLRELPLVWEPFWNTYVGIGLALGVPSLFFLLFGLMVFQARVAGGFLAIMTLAMLAAVYAMAYDMQAITAGFNGISPPFPFELLGYRFDPYSSLTYWTVVGVLAVLTLATKALLETKFGLVTRAIRNDPERARFLGYNVAAYQVVIFTISGFIAAFAGVLWVMVTQYVSPTALEVTLSISFVVWAAIGGRLSLFGAIIGALFVNSMQSYAGAALEELWFVVLGAIFILVVRFLPNGLSSLIEYGLGRLSGGSRARVGDEAKHPAE